MAASAKELIPSHVGLVYLGLSFPSLLVRISAPYWFDKVSYSKRMGMCFVLFASGFTITALAGSQKEKLVGIVFTSIQQALGETSLLALSTRYGNKSLTFWSSGTGAAGLMGYGYVVLLNHYDISTRDILLGSNAIAVCYYLTFLTFTIPPPKFRAISECFEVKVLDSKKKAKLSPQERFNLTLSLWPWAIPLIVVYFAEYALQSGTWSSIGFPVTSKTSRDDFYKYANWSYQAGVLISRSSGLIWKPGMLVLWLLPILQVVVLILSTVNAAEQWWYNNGLLGLSGFVGLIGGLVYVNGFRLIAEGVNPEHVELATAAASVSSDLGTNGGEVLGIWIQSLLYGKLGIED